jgi:hypothetical protein
VVVEPEGCSLQPIAFSGVFDWKAEERQFDFYFDSLR